MLNSNWTNTSGRIPGTIVPGNGVLLHLSVIFKGGGGGKLSELYVQGNCPATAGNAQLVMD